MSWKLIYLCNTRIFTSIEKNADKDIIVSFNGDFMSIPRQAQKGKN